MDVGEGTTLEDLWTPFKELVAVVEGYLANEGSGTQYAVHTFEAVLRRHKQSFLSLFKNPPKNPASREEIKRGITEGVNLPSLGRTLLSKELVDEAIIISDMYNVNEYAALELLHSARGQASRHPSLARGLIAVLLYYDGRRALAHALRELAQCTHGVCWTVNVRDEIITYVSRYMDQLVSDGLLSNILDTLRRSSLQSELELLQANRALPPQPHHSRLVNTIQSSRKLLAGVVFARAAQRGLPRDIILRLISEQSTSPSLGPTGALDDISLALQMALLYALDLSVLHSREDGEELAKKLPLIQDQDLIMILIDELSPPAQMNQSQDNQEKGTGVRALCQLSLGLALAALKRAPQSLLRKDNGEPKFELLDQDEMLVDAAIDGKVFEYLDESILSTDLVVKEEYYQRRIHMLITDFIVLMHSKLMEMRVKADESARAVQMYLSEGVCAPAGAGASRSRLDALLRCVERLYTCDPLQLRQEYWRACSAGGSRACGGRAATLYKFVRLSGEVVGAGLVARYVRALAALAVPAHTWQLLSRRLALSAHHLLTALALYRDNLRADSTPFVSHLHSSLGATAIVTPAARPGKLLVRQEEVEAMIAALKLIAAVARVDKDACVQICENPQWDAVNCMFGLICCHIPIQLKAELCLTLAELGSTPATVGRVWTALEAAQLVAAGKDKRALTAELQEVECRMEEYPLSRAFVQLLLSLCSSGPAPRALGAGQRPPGLDPYLNHVINKLALPAHTRRYVKPHEKWQVLSLCLKLFSLWLEVYSPSAGEFGGECGAAPGHRLLLLLHTDSELLRLLLHTYEEALQAYHTAHGEAKAYMEDCMVYALEMLDRALALEKPLLAAAAESGRAPYIVGLSKLVYACSSGGSWRVSWWLAGVGCGGRVGAAALALLARGPPQPLLPACTAHHAPQHIRHAFVECLEADEVGDVEAVRRAKEGVLALLQRALPAAPHNLAHFLLGYRLDDQVSRSALNEPGVAGFPRTCLHSILDILDNHIAAGQNNADREASDLVESCYRLLYLLCSRPSTSGPLLRYLRSRDHFLARHVKAVVNLETASVSTISSRSWVLRACACEAGAAAAGRHHAALAALLSATLRPPDSAQEWEWCLIRRTLEGLSVWVSPCEEPRWELFHKHQLRQAIAACDLPTGAGGSRISVSRVHALLARELHALHAAAPQRPLVANEIQKVLDYVTEVNRQRNLAATLTHYYDSWRQLAEIIFCVAPADMLDIETKKNLLLNLLQDLLNKIPPAEVLPQIGNLASGTVLLLLVNLRHCYIIQKRESDLKSNDFESTFFGPSNQIMQTKSLTLKFILHKILSWILVSSGSTQKMRVNLYGALLNFLNIVNLKPSPAEPEEEMDDSLYVSRLDSSKARPNREESSLKSMVVDVISGFGDNLSAIVCSDCIGGGHDVCRMVSLACLETLVEIDPRTDWLSTLTNQGYLRSLIDSLLQDDDGLKESLDPNPKSLRVLYVYESKMALLIKIAGNRFGAETVLSQGALSCLANMKVLDHHPDIHTGYADKKDTDFVPSVANRFRQILLPALALCDALLTSLGTENHSCVIHVTHFLISHIECIDVVLRAAHPSSPSGLIEEVEAVTSVCARASSAGVVSAASHVEALQHAAPALRRLHALLVALLQRWPAHVATNAAADNDDNASQLYCKIACNILTYFRNTSPLSVESGGVESGVVGAVCSLLQLGVCRHAALAAAAAHLAPHNVHNMTLEEMQKLLPEGNTVRSASEARACLRSLLSRRRARHQRRTAHCALACDAALQLLWTRAHTYLRLTALPNEQRALTLGKAVRGAFSEEIVELKKMLISLFNDRFVEQLLDTAKNQPPTQRSYLELLVKDIKSMIQFSTI